MHPVQILVGSLVPASLYALVGVGFVTVYRSSRVLNFAQGQMTLIGAYLFYTAFSWTDGEAPAIIVALLLAACVGLVTYLLFMRPVTGRGPVILIMLTIVIGSLFEGIYTIVWGTSVKYLHNPFPSGGIRIPGGAVTSPADIAIVAVTTVVIGGFALLLKYTVYGVMTRAAAENPSLASNLGIRINRLIAASWGFAVITATLAGIAYGMRTSVDPTLVALGLTTFPAILIGGLDSIGGVLVGAFILALLQGIIGSTLGGEWTIPVAYLVLLAVLVVRPTGLFGSESQERL